MLSPTACPDYSGKSRNAGKTFLQTLFFFLLVTQICFGQWYQQNSGITSNLNSVHFENASNGWAVGDSGTILHTTNGGQEWTIQASGTIFCLYDIYFVDANIGWAVGGEQTWEPSFPDSSVILHTTDAGTSWTKQWFDSGNTFFSVYFINSNYGWAVGASGTILRTTNGGINWTPQTSGIEFTLYDVCFTDGNMGIAVGGGEATTVILKTTDGGSTWIEQQVQTHEKLMSVTFTNAVTGFAVGYEYSGLSDNFAGILRTTDGGTNWPRVLSLVDTRFTDVFFVNTSNGWVVGYLFDWYGCIFNTTDGGTIWVNQMIIEPDSRLYSVFFTNDLTGWVVGNNGIILHTTNGGVPVELTSFTATPTGKEVVLNWSTATELNNLGFEIQRSTEAEEFFTIGFVNGHGTTTEHQNYNYADKNLDDGNYYYRLKQVDYDGSYEYSEVVEVDFRTFNSYLLEQNFPNPFNPTTTIGFGIQNKSSVKITIQNAIGEEVAVILNEEKDSGYHTVEFNAANLPSGVYFYQLKAGDFISTKKMILMK